MKRTSDSVGHVDSDSTRGGYGIPPTANYVALEGDWEDMHGLYGASEVDLLEWGWNPRDVYEDASVQNK